MTWFEEEFGKYGQLERESTIAFEYYHKGRQDGKMSAANEIEIFAAKTGNQLFTGRSLPTSQLEG